MKKNLDEAVLEQIDGGIRFETWTATKLDWAGNAVLAQSTGDNERQLAWRYLEAVGPTIFKKIGEGMVPPR